MSLDEQEAERLFQRKRTARPDDSDSYAGGEPAASAAEVAAVDADEDFGVEVKRNAGTAAHGGVLCRGVFFQTSPRAGCAEGEGSLCEVSEIAQTSVCWAEDDADAAAFRAEYMRRFQEQREFQAANPAME